MTTINIEPNVTLTSEQIRQAALSLPLGDREEVISELLTSVENERSEIDRSWLDEVKRRIATFERGESQLIDHEDVVREIDEQISQLATEGAP